MLGSSSISSYLTELTNKIFSNQKKNKNQESSEQNQDQKNDDESQTPNDNSSEKKEHRKFTLSSAEIKGWPDAAIKTNLTTKHLQAGWKPKELEQIDNKTIFLEADGEKTDLEIPEDIMIDRQVETFKKLREYVFEREKAIKEHQNKIEEDSQTNTPQQDNKQNERLEQEQTKKEDALLEEQEKSM